VCCYLVGRFWTRNCLNTCVRTAIILTFISLIDGFYSTLNEVYSHFSLSCFINSDTSFCRLFRISSDTLTVSCIIKLDILRYIKFKLITPVPCKCLVIFLNSNPDMISAHPVSVRLRGLRIIRKRKLKICSHATRCTANTAEGSGAYLLPFSSYLHGSGAAAFQLVSPWLPWKKGRQFTGFFKVLADL